ncbi:MAG: hypothetical protein ACTHN7_09385 [Solirubrobacterales bacterium]
MNPLRDAEQEFEEHERELWEQLVARMEGMVPPGASVREAIEAMRDSAGEHAGIEELLCRVTSMAEMGGGTYLKEKLDAPMPPPREEPVYQLADQPTKAIVQEEIRLMDRLRREIDDRIGTDVQGAQRHDRIRELLDEDEELSALAERLDKLSQSHDESVMLGLARLAEEEESREEEDEEAGF